MEKYKLTIPGELPDMNTIIAKANLGAKNYQAYSQLKEKNTGAVAWIAKTEIKKRLDRINVHINWVCKNRRKDKDNIMAGTKFVFDGLVKAGVISGDGWKQIGEISHSFEVDKKNPRVEVYIEVV